MFLYFTVVYLLYTALLFKKVFDVIMITCSKDFYKDSNKECYYELVLFNLVFFSECLYYTEILQYTETTLYKSAVYVPMLFYYL